jgi:hypothetical protein
MEPSLTNGPVAVCFTDACTPPARQAFSAESENKVMAERVAALSRDVEAAREELRRTAANNRAEVETLRETCAPPSPPRPVPSAPPSTGP